MSDVHPILINQDLLITAGISLILLLLTVLWTLATLFVKQLFNRFDTKIENCHAGLRAEVAHLVEHGKETREIAIQAHTRLTDHVKDLHVK